MSGNDGRDWLERLHDTLDPEARRQRDEMAARLAHLDAFHGNVPTDMILSFWTEEIADAACAHQCELCEGPPDSEDVKRWQAAHREFRARTEASPDREAWKQAIASLWAEMTPTLADGTAHVWAKLDPMPPKFG